MRNKHRKHSKPIIQILIIFVVVGFVGLCFLQNNNNNNNKLNDDMDAVEWNGNQALPKPSLGNSPAIEIPGFTEVVFIANQTTQKVNFYNPKNNDCYFQMNLYVENELLWQSGNIAPGKGYYQIELNKPFDKCGVTSGYLKIRCFKKNGTELNSATVKFKVVITEQGDK